LLIKESFSLTEQEKGNKFDWIRLLRWLFRAFVSLGLIFFLLHKANIKEVARSIIGMNLGWFAMAVLIKGTGILAGIIRWQLLLHGQKLKLGFTNLAGAYLIGRFLGSFLPSTIGLDVYRTYYSSIRTRKVARCVGVTLVEKIIGLFSLSLLTLVAIPFGLRLIDERLLWALGLAMCVPILVCSAVLFWPGLFVKISDRFRASGKRTSQGLARLSAAVGRFGHQRGRLVVASFWGLLVHSGTAAMYIATARAVGIEISAMEILFIGPLMIAATLIPISIAGIGDRETVYAAVLTGTGVPPEQAALLGTLGFLAGEVFSLTGGVVWLIKPASRPEEGIGLMEVMRRVVAWTAFGKKPETQAEQGVGP
jgi:uncharacterized protein (TIRG00374 family)